MTMSPETPQLALARKRRAARDPGRPGTRCTGDEGVWIPIVDHGRCEGKWDCVVVCPHDVFEIRRTDESDFKQLPRLPRCASSPIAHRRQTAFAPNAVAPRRLTSLSTVNDRLNHP